MSLTTDQARTLAGSNGNVLSSGGDKIGSIGQIYLDDATSEPTWVTAKTGLFGTSESFVPLEGATVSGDDVVVAYDKAKVKDAPRVDPDGSLSPEQEDELYAYYGVGTTSGAGYADTTTGAGYADTTADAGVEGGYVENTAGAGTRSDAGNEHGTVGHDTSGPTTDDAMTRSEEQVRVGTAQTETGRARLRKYVVTENVTQTVPVSHEEVRLEREPITDANVGDALDGPAISEEEHEVTLHAEKPVVEKEAVPVERVRMDKETVTDQETVSEEVRKEQIEVDGGDDTRR